MEEFPASPSKLQGDRRAPQGAEARRQLRAAYDDALAVVGEIEAGAGPTLRDELGRAKRVQAAYQLGEDRERFRRRRLGLRSGLLKLMRAELGTDPTGSDRARLYVRHMLMASANVAAVTGSGWPSTRAWLRERLPTLMDTHGPEIEADFLAYLAEAGAELAKRYHAGDENMHTGPKPADIAEAFGTTTIQLRQAKANHCGLTSIDPQDRRTRDRERKERERRAAGMKPQSERSDTTTMKDLAGRLGCSLATLYRKRGGQPLDAFLAAHDQAENDLSPIIMDLDGGHFVLTPANDDVPDLNRQIREDGYHGRNLIMEPWMVEQAIEESPEIAENLAESFAAVDAMLETVEMPELRPPTEIGFYGQNITMSAWEVRMAVERHPALNDDLAGHLDAIDALMAKTLPDYRKRVSRNLLADRNRIALRRRRMHAQDDQSGVAA